MDAKSVYIVEAAEDGEPAPKAKIPREVSALLGDEVKAPEGKVPEGKVPEVVPSDDEGADAWMDAGQEQVAPAAAKKTKQWAQELFHSKNFPEQVSFEGELQKGQADCIGWLAREPRPTTLTTLFLFCFAVFLGRPKLHRCTSFAWIRIVCISSATITCLSRRCLACRSLRATARSRSCLCRLPVRLRLQDSVASSASLS